MNQLCIVGRLVSDPQIKILESGKKETTVTIAVNRTFKNVDGVYETDFIPCVLWEAVAENTTEYCRRGDIIGIRGRLQCMPEDDGDGHITNSKLVVIAERVTFLSASHNTNV